MTRYSRRETQTGNKAWTMRFITAFIAVAIAFTMIFTMSGIPAAWAQNDTNREGGHSATNVVDTIRQMQANDRAEPADSSSSAITAANTPKNESVATILVYMNGSDLESDGGAASADIAEMLDSGIGANANVVIETLGTREWQDFGIASDHTQRYIVNQGKLELVDDSLVQLDTTAPETLSDFISWGTKNYPAQRYFLLLWDHGAGPVYGFGYDEFQSDYAALTLDEMKQALDANADVHFDAIGMDCCIMSSLETCYVFAPYCDYTILSEDFEPGIGWSYKSWMSALETNPSISTEELGGMIVDGMIKDVEADEENGDATLALIDESAIPSLYSAWIDFAYANEDTLLESNYSQEMEWHGWLRAPGSQNGHGSSGHGPGSHGQSGNDVNGGLFGWNDPEYELEDDYGYGCDYGHEYGRDYGYGYGSPADGLEDSLGWSDPYGWGDIWNDDESYVTMTDYYVTDILEVASTIESTESSALQTAVENAIVHYGKTSGETGMTGIGVTLPYGDAEFYDELVDVFSACGIDKTYVNWLQAFVDASGADDYYDFGYDVGSLDREPHNTYGFGYEHNAYGYGDAYNPYGYGRDERPVSIAA